MSTPARKLAPRPEPVPFSQPPARPSRAPAARPPVTTPPSPSRRARRGSPHAFWFFAAVIVTAMVVAVVSVSALLVRASFRMDSLESRIAELKVAQEDLIRQEAEISSPSRVSEWAHAHGFVMPDGVVILSVSSRAKDGRA